jgi:hypothetical protein
VGFPCFLLQTGLHSHSQAFTVNLAGWVGYTQRGWYDEVGPLISYGAKAENLKTKQRLYAQVRRVLACVVAWDDDRCHT